MEKKKTQKPPMTIKEIVDDLRAKGELDEEALKRFNRKQQSTSYTFLAVIGMAIFLNLPSANHITTLGVPAKIWGWLCIIYITPCYIKELLRDRELVKLYTYGETSFVKIKHIKRLPGIIRERGWDMFVDSDIENFKNIKVCMSFRFGGLNNIYIHGSKPPETVGELQHEYFINKTVKLLYLSDNKNICTIFCAERNKYYNFKRNSNLEQ